MEVWERAQEVWDVMLEVSLFGEFKSALIYIILH